MSKYKLFRLMDTLSKKEIINAEHYLNGIYTEEDSPVIKLFRGINKMVHQEKDDLEIKQLLFYEIFPENPFDDRKMRKLMTRLTHELEDFIIQQELGNDSIKNHLLAKALYHRSDYKLFKEAVENRLRALEKKKKRGIAYFREKFQLLQSIYFHPETAKYTTKNDFFQEYAFYQECYIVLSSLMTGAEGLSRKRAIKSQDNFKFLEVAIEMANNMGEACPKVILLFKELVELLKNRNKRTDLKKLKNRVSSTFEMMEADEQRMALKLLIAYATPESNRGEKEYNRFIFDLYKMGIEYQLLKNGDSPIETTLFLNIAITGSTIGDLKWTKQFITDYYTELAKDDISLAFNLCMAAWHYKRGMVKNQMDDLKEALYLLNLIPTRSEEIFDLRARSLSLRIIFDLFVSGEMTFEMVYENARNFERHLTNNSTYSMDKINAYVAFIDHCRKLARIHNDVNKSDLVVRSFVKSLQADQSCVIKQWLLEKAEEVLPSSAFHD